MNYYNPYFNMYPYMTSQVVKPGIFSRIFGSLKGINFSSILSGTQKTLGIVNQTIPLVKQATPIVKNAKTMFKVMNEFKRVDIPTKKNNVSNEISIKNDSNHYVSQTNSSEGPTFFL
ncbi:MAG: hypothetical protein E7157_03340 [Lactobacillales bacterium]|nr:hypothetical protein [Lactobacillales bacterium]